MYPNRNNKMVRNNTFEILSLYCAGYSQRFFLREISRKTKIPLKTTQVALAELEKNSILKSKVEGKNKYFYLNIDYPIAKNMILQAEIYKTIFFIEKHKTVELFLNNLNSNQPIILFGSYAKGLERKESDFDLMIIGSDTALPLHLLPYSIHKIEISEKNLRISVKEGEALIKEVQLNHIILNNHSFYVNELWNQWKKERLRGVLN